MQKETKVLHLKSNAPFIKCISKINGVQIDNQCIICLNTVKITEKQQLVSGIITEMNLIILLLIMMTLLLFVNDNAGPITNSKSFKYKSSITGKNIRWKSRKW